MKPSVSRAVRLLLLFALFGAALAGVYGVGHQTDLSRTQLDCRVLQRVIEFAVAGHNPYNRAAVDAAFASSPFKVYELFYPPSFIALTAPFILLGDFCVRVLVVCAQVACFLLLVSPARNLPQRVQPLLVLSPVVFFSLFQTARFGQITCIACAAAVLLWNRLPRSKNLWLDGALLFVATVKPSSTVAVVLYLLFERRFAVVFVAGLLHAIGALLAGYLTGVDALELTRSWINTLPTYRDFSVNTPEGNVVYGISVLAHRFSSRVVNLELIALPLTYLVWRMRQTLAPAESFALVLLIAFMVGTPHAYDFFMLVPAMVSMLGRTRGVWTTALVTLMVVVPQRVLEPLVGQPLESLPRVLAPVVLFVALIVQSSRTARGVAGALEKRPVGVRQQAGPVSD